MTARLASVDDVLALYARRGDEHYGEDVTQTSHALQAAALAVAEGAPDALVAAALLHDVGHLLAPPRPPGWRDDVDDDDHEAVGARALAPLFGPVVAGPVSLHVTAKRWRCAVEPAYLAALSPTSAATLRAQGGPLDGDERERFEHHPRFAAAVLVRRWDDAAKDPSAPGGTMEPYDALLRRVAGAVGDESL